MSKAFGIKITENINYENPKTVVCGLINAMKKWELESDIIDTKYEDSDDSDKILDEIEKNIDAVFDAFCTQKPRPYGRQGNFRMPPEYDPNNETIVESPVDKNKAYVTTK